MARILTRAAEVSIMAVVAFSRAVDMAAPGAVRMLREDARVSEAVADRVQNRFSSNPHGGVARGGIDAELLQQTVHAVVAAVAAAQKVPEAAGASQVQATVPTETGVASRDAVVSVAVPTVLQQQGVAARQEGTDPQITAAKGKEDEGPGPSKKKKEEKMGCFRCKQPGHYIDDCPTPFCDLCESVNHSTSACHLLHAPKPTAILHGYANEGLMFFELPCGAFKAKVENPKLAKVTVEGNAMTIPEIIEQLKKIVPHEKFNWEVFHFKDNIFRVKLPSKQEVQRLKNFGTYICSDRESCLSFDLWSALEDPLYMLPEVWVRVSGLPSDMRADYLSLWGVGTLFGKTSDVDMAYTRKNKVLRIKIGCLDSRLIPADSDVFIRRGFFKLKFVVENSQGSQEVNMVEANNGNDGNGDAKDGEGNNGGANAMDMDPKRSEVHDTSNNNVNGGSNGTNGGDGMQEQIELFEAIQIGSMSLKLTPSGGYSFDPNLSTNYPPFSSLCHVENLFENDKDFTDFHSDLIHRGSVLGLSPVRPRDACMQAVPARDSSHSASALRSVSERWEQRSSSQPLLATPGKVAGGGSACSVQQEQHGDSEPASAACANHAGERSGSGLPLHAPCASVGRARTEEGSSVVAVVVPSVPSSDFSPQKIRHGKTRGHGMHAQAAANHEAMSANDLQSLLTPGGSSVAVSAAANGLARKFKNGIMDGSMMNETKEQGVGLQGSMGIASSPRTKEEVIAFGGIPKPTVGLRSSTRLGGQPNADMPLMEKAMKNAQLHDDSLNTG
ncbi:hypothetical protein ACQ4PT_063075 [Festuca glaucescens]